jgi:hypothetical protein
MTKRNDRTRAGQETANLSDLTIRSLDRQTRFSFDRWLPRFRAEIRTNEKAAAWKALKKAGCHSHDLEWAFYWAIDSIDTASYVPAKLRAFREESLNVLREILRLQPAVNTLMELQVLQEPVWQLFFGLHELPTTEAVRFFRFQVQLAKFQAMLK